MKNIIVITGASSGFGALAARALAIRWEEVFRAQGMKNPTPRIQMIEVNEALTIEGGGAQRLSRYPLAQRTAPGRR